jgi:hypothetical protein
MLTELLLDYYDYTSSVHNHGYSVRDYQFCVYSENYCH